MWWDKLGIEYGGSDDKDINLSVICNRFALDSALGYYDILGWVRLANRYDYIDGGKMMFSDIEFNYGSLSNNRYGYLFEFSNLTPPKEFPKFGIYANWGISGNELNNIPKFYTTLYSPKEIIMSLPDDKDKFSAYPVSLQDILEINWNKDESNKRGVWIWLSNSLNDPKFNYFYYINVPDTGHFSLNLNEMLLPTDKPFDLIILRNNEELFVINNLRIVATVTTLHWRLINIR